MTRNRIYLGITALLTILLSSCYQEQIMKVKAGFVAEVANNNYTVPALVKLSNTTIGAENYAWSFAGTTPASSSERNPGTLQYNNPGTYTIHLEADNQYGGKDSRDTTFTFDADILPAFTLINNGSWYPDVTTHIVNRTSGATTYQWSFSGGTPSSSSQEQPGDIVFSTPGTYTVSLKAGNGRVSYTKDTTVTVLPDLVNDFDITWATDDNDMEVPFTAYLSSKCVSATHLQWSIAGGAPSSSQAASPVVTYTLPGTYTISLSASNDKKSIVRAKSLTLRSNSNLFQFKDVCLGINTAQNSVGCFFSSHLGKVLKATDVNDANGSSIDIVYFGFDGSFGYNKFVSPSTVQNYTFSYIPNAITTRIINRQESCGCGTSMTSAQFDAMTDDVLLQATAINQISAGLSEFDNSGLPRIVLFQTQDGRKGAIKIKQCVQAGKQSYIVCDIKIMKNA